MDLNKSEGMTKIIPIRRNKRPGDEGYVLLAVIFMVTIVVISMSIAASKIAKDIQREREVETMHRGKQYARAIKLYYHKFGTYPPNVDALLNTNQIRFLRKRYLDPMTGKDDWKPIMVGQNKTPLAMGFFGEPLGIPGSPLGGGSGALPSGGSVFGSGGNPPFGSGNSGTATDPGLTGDQSAGANSGGDSNASSGSDSSGQTFGGAGIMGVVPGSPKESMLVYKKKNHYNEWEFLYSPLSDPTLGNRNPFGQPPLQGGAPGAPPPAPAFSGSPQTSPQ